MGAQPTKEPRNGEAGSPGVPSSGNSMNKKNHLIEEINAMTHDGETFMKIIEISQKLYRHYSENFLNEEFCKKLAMIYQKRLLQLDLETLRGIHSAMNAGNSVNNSGNSRKFQALLSYQPGENEAFMVSEFKKQLEEYLWNHDIEYKPEIYSSMGIPDNEIPIKIIDPQNRLRYIDIAHVNELLSIPTGNSSKKSSGNATGNGTGNSAGNSSGNATGNGTEEGPVVKGGFRRDRNRNRRNSGNSNGNDNYPSYSNGSNLLSSSSSRSGSSSASSSSTRLADQRSAASSRESSSSSFYNRGNSSTNNNRVRPRFSNSESNGRSRSRLNKNLNEFNENMNENGERNRNRNGGNRRGPRNEEEALPPNQSSGRRPPINLQKNSQLRKLEEKLSLASKEFGGFNNGNRNQNRNRLPPAAPSPSAPPAPPANNRRNMNAGNGAGNGTGNAGSNNDLVQFFAQIPNKNKGGRPPLPLPENMGNHGEKVGREMRNRNRLFFSARGYNKPANVCGGTGNSNGNGPSCKMTKSQLCRAITDHFMVRGNIIAAILSTLPKKTSKGFEGGFCYQRFLNLDKCQVCLPHNYDELMTMDPKTRIQTMMLFINYMTEKECNEKNGLFRKLSLSEKMSLIDNARRGERFNRLYSEYTQNVRHTYMEHLGYLLDILNVLSTMEGINNEQLNELAMKTKETIDSMYHLCQFYYLYAVIALLNANIKPAENNMTREKNKVASSMESFLVRK